MVGGKRFFVLALFLLVITPLLIKARPDIVSNTYQYTIPDYNEMPEMYREVVNEVKSDIIYYELNLSNVYINETENYSEVVLDDFFFTRNFGMPILPIKYFEIPVPSDAKSFEIEIVNPAYTEINVNKKIKPFEPEGHYSLYGPPRYEIYENYSSSTDFITVDFGYRGKQKYALVRYYPFGYDSRNGRLNVTTSVILKIAYTNIRHVGKKKESKVLPMRPITALSEDQVPKLEWENTFGGSMYDSGHSVQQTSDGGFIVAGTTQSYGAGFNDVYLIKTDVYGNKQWEKTFGGNKSDGAESVLQTSDGGYILVGYTYSFGAGSVDVYLLKMYYNGTKQWEKTFGGGSDEYGYSIEKTSDGGYIITGNTKSFGAGGFDVYLIKTDQNGNEEWNKTFGGIDDQFGYSVQQTIDGGYITVGSTGFSSYFQLDLSLIKTYSDGTKQWAKVFGGGGSQEGYAVRQTLDGGYIVCGEDYTFDYSNFLVMRTDKDGNKEWNNTFDYVSTNQCNSIMETSNGGYILGGAGGGFTTGSERVLLAKVNATGGEEWHGIYPSDNGDGQSVKKTSDSGYIAAGKKWVSGASYDVYLAKLKGQDNCSNGIKDGDETDVDCGGSCPLCDDGKRCNTNSDCKNEWCKQGICKPLPVLLVHGFYGSSESWDPSMFSEFEVVDTLNLTPSNGDIKKLALQVKNKVRQMKEEHHVNKIDIVAHSMGGLVSRWYTQNDYQNDVRKLIMIGTPNHGSDWGYLKDIGFVHSVLGGIITNLLVGPAGAQMIPHSGFLEELNGNSKCADKREGSNDKLIETVEHYTIWSNCCGTLTHFHKYINTRFGSIEFVWPGFSEGDFIVPKDSTKLDTVSLKQVGTYFHRGQGKTEEIVEEVKKMLNGVQITGLLSTYHMLGTAEENEYFVHTVKIAMDVLHQGETKEYNIYLDNSSKNTYLILNFGESELNFSLISPSGLVITQNSSPEITYSSVESLMQYYVPNPETGDWTLSIEGLNVTNSEVNFSLVAFIETDLILGLSAGGYHFKPGEQVNISALFSKYLEPIVNATVSVTIKKPGNSTETFFLYDDGTHNDIKAGDGIYTNYFTASLEGAYYITADANISIGGRKIVRNAQLTIWVELLPDLIVSSILLSNETLFEGDDVTINATIINIRDNNVSNVLIEFYDALEGEEYLIGSTEVSVPSHGGIASIVWRNIFEGNHSVTVFITPYNEFLETNYSNNKKVIQVYVAKKVMEKCNISFHQGWNLISIPIDLTDKSTNSVFSGLNTSIYSYKNNSWFVPNEIDNELGYWLKINESKNLTLIGTEMENITMDLNEGWNLISYPSLNTTSVDESLKDVTYDIILTYENNKWLSYSPSKPSYLNTLKNLTSWHGYWVKVPYNATWTFDGIFK